MNGSITGPIVDLPTRKEGFAGESSLAAGTSLPWRLYKHDDSGGPPPPYDWGQKDSGTSRVTMGTWKALFSIDLDPGIWKFAIDIDTPQTKALSQIFEKGGLSGGGLGEMVMIDPDVALPTAFVGAA
jgi:hypothetical protein